MKNTQVHVVVISLFIHLAASRMEDVEITNKLGGGLTLTLHCKSKDDDLDVQTLAPDSSWSFKFSPAVLKTTLFFCNFTWGGESHWFDIYDDNRDGDGRDFPCYLCPWNINRNGPCRFNQATNAFDVCYYWNGDRKE
ncbi:hypothetical protein BRARA_C00502 [Brassica rapa]|uniref:S-protein homolog n=1 Tax=Brassica campestris TaxID=3711 RepID=A0A397ZZL0_BRACM|nr:hypothetical protein BRARA_C00502 [Brassica rapa]